MSTLTHGHGEPFSESEAWESYSKLLKNIFMPDQPAPLAKEKVRRNAQTIFMEKFEKMSIEEKGAVIQDLTDILNTHKQKTIDEAQALIDRLTPRSDY